MFGNKANAAKWDFQLQEQTLQDESKVVTFNADFTTK